MFTVVYSDPDPRVKTKALYAVSCKCLPWCIVICLWHADCPDTDHHPRVKTKALYAVSCKCLLWCIVICLLTAFTDYYSATFIYLCFCLSGCLYKNFNISWIFGRSWSAYMYKNVHKCTCSLWLDLASDAIHSVCLLSALKSIILWTCFDLKIYILINLSLVNPFQSNTIVSGLL